MAHTTQLNDTVMLLQESVKAERGMLRNVKVLGLESRNRRRYTREAIASAIKIYDGKPINVDHPASPNGPRGLRDRFGRLTNLRIDRDGGLRGDLKYNPEHPLARTVEWFAANDPACLGLSHNAMGSGRTELDGTFVVEKIESVRSVDLVADPATTKGLFESMDPLNTTTAIDDTGADLGSPEDEGYEAHVGHLVTAIMKDSSLDTKGKKTKILKALKLLDDAAAASNSNSSADDDAEGTADYGDDPVEESVALLRSSNDPRVKRLVERLDSYVARDRLQVRRQKARDLCRQLRLPDVLVTEVFVEQLASAANDTAMKALIEDRRTVAGARRPVSAAPGGHGGHGGRQMTVKEFARQIQ